MGALGGFLSDSEATVMKESQGELSSNRPVTGVLLVSHRGRLEGPLKVVQGFLMIAVLGGE